MPHIVTALFVAILLLSVLLLIAATALCGRYIADLEYQRLTVIDKIREIESKSGIRTQGNRILLAIGALLIMVLHYNELEQKFFVMITLLATTLLLSMFAISSVMDWLAEYKKMKVFLQEAKRSHVDTEE